MRRRQIETPMRSGRNGKSLAKVGEEQENLLRESQVRHVL